MSDTSNSASNTNNRGSDSQFITEISNYPIQSGTPPKQDDDLEMTILCPTLYESVYPPPTMASSHIDSNIVNYQYNTKIHISKRRAQETPVVKEAMERGIILHAPGDICFSTQHMENPNRPTISAAFMENNSITVHSMPSELGTNWPTYRICLQWAIDVPEGYSLLCVEPFFKTEENYKTLPTMIDGDAGLVWVNCTIQLLQNGTRIQYGDPLIQVIPIPHESLQLDAVIEERP